MASSPLPSLFLAEHGAFCRKILAESAAREDALPPSALLKPTAPPSSAEIHTPPSLRGKGSGLGGQNGWILSVVGTARICD